MKAVIISIGDELLIGQTVNTNAAWLASELDGVGLQTTKIITIPDDEEIILESLETAKNKADLIITTGGLGPTKDDRTKQTFCKFFKTELVEDNKILQTICDHFDKQPEELLKRNREQALIPEKATPLPNKEGTAPGFWFDEQNKVFIVLPGVPSEMKKMFQEAALSKIKDRFDTPVLLNKHILTVGIRESVLSEKLDKFEEQLPSHIRLAYLPQLGIVKLRLRATGTDQKKLEKDILQQVKQLKQKVGSYIFGFDNDSLPSVIGQQLRKREVTITTAESCTGGYLAHQLTGVPGSSKYYQGSLISYSNTVKKELLNVPAPLLEKEGAVSKAVVKKMAEGARALIGADYALSTSGIAGPGGGTPEKPVGTVWIGLATPQKTIAKLYHFKRSRQQNIHLTAVFALALLRQQL